MISQTLATVRHGRRVPVASILWAALEARRQRRALSRLDDAALSDIGLDRKSAEAEASRPVWDVPVYGR